MKQKIIMALIAIAGCMGCAKLYEDIGERHIERPNYDTELPSPPFWDSIPQTDIPIGG